MGKRNGSINFSAAEYVLVNLLLLGNIECCKVNMSERALLLMFGWLENQSTMAAIVSRTVNSLPS